MCFSERETRNFLLNIGNIPMERNSAQIHGMKFNEKLFFCQIYARG